METWGPAATPACLHTGGSASAVVPHWVLSSKQQGPRRSSPASHAPRALRHKFNAIPPQDQTHTLSHDSALRTATNTGSLLPAHGAGPGHEPGLKQ